MMISRVNSDHTSSRSLAAFFFHVLYQRFTLTQTQTRYAQFNTLTVTGRIFNAEIVDNNGQQWLSVTLISTASKDGADLLYTFNNNNGLMKLHESGYFGKGRQVTITGHIHNVSEVYTTKTGEVRMRKRPEIHLTGVTVLDGGLGPMPNSDAQPRKVAGTVVNVGTPSDEMPPLDKTPDFGDATATDDQGVPMF